MPLPKSHLNVEWQMSKAAFYLFQRSTSQIYPAYAARARTIMHAPRRLYVHLPSTRISVLQGTGICDLISLKGVASSRLADFTFSTNRIVPDHRANSTGAFIFTRDSGWFPSDPSGRDSLSLVSIDGARRQTRWIT